MVLGFFGYASRVTAEFAMLHEVEQELMMAKTTSTTLSHTFKGMFPSMIQFHSRKNQNDPIQIRTIPIYSWVAMLLSHT